MMALPREHVPQRQWPQRLRGQMRTRNVGEPAPPPAEPPNREAPPPPQAPDPEPPAGPRFAAAGIPPDHAAAQARIVSFEPDGLAEQTEFLMAGARAFAGHADAFCAQAHGLIHRPGVAPAVLRGTLEFADRIGKPGPGPEQATKGRHKYWIETVADVARLTDAQVDELEQAVRADRGGVRNGDVARWREHARQLLTEGEPATDQALATFVVEARESADGTGGEPRFAVHHIEGR